MNREFDLVRVLEPESPPPSAEVIEHQRAILATKIREGDSAVRGSRRARTTIARGIAATFVILGLGGSAAFAVSQLSPNAHDAAMVQQHSRVAAPVHRPGWRPELDAERVVCDFRGLGLATTSAYTYASGFPLTQPLTAARLAQECRTGTDATAGALPLTAPATLCSVIPPGEQHAVPVVTFGPARCAPPLSGAPASLLDERNRMRRDEAAILAVPQTCPTVGQAEKWVQQQLARSAATLTALPVEPDADGRCYLPHVHWGRGVVEIIANIEPGSPGTAPPTSVP